jgi:two-component system sensor histidine kinase RegB
VTRRSPGLLYGLGNLVDNAADFAVSCIVIEAHWTAHEVCVEIRDDGPGFPSDVLLRVGEPYVTTRGRGREGDDSGSGLGLGLFIAKTLIERSGGQLALANAAPPGHGAVARIVWLRTSFDEKTAITTTGSALAPLTESETVPI